MIRSKVLVLIFVAAALISGCSDDDDATTTTTSASGDGVELVVAPELAGIAELLAEAYAADGTAGVTVVVEEQESLVASVSSRRPDMVLAPKVWLTDPSLEVVDFGRNLAVVVVPAGNPDGITGLDVFAADSELATAVCGEDSPIGNPALLVLAAAGVTPDPATVAPGCDDDAARRVAAGELDAALIFRAGVVMPDGTDIVELPEAGNLVIELSYVALGDAATGLADFLAGDTAQQILTQNGYLP